MLRVDGYYLYELGHKIHVLSSLQGEIGFGGDTGSKKSQWLFSILGAEIALSELLDRSVFDVKLAQEAGQALLDTITSLREEAQRSTDPEATFGYAQIAPLQVQLREFETILRAELRNSALYQVSAKSAFDSQTLVLRGEFAFPPDLVFKVPSSISDAQQAMRCIAFELSTAAAFHLHRVNETVLGKYWDAASNGKKKPKNPNMGMLLASMEKEGFGDKKILSALRDIKDMHRNPIIHPENELTDVEEAINLFGAIRSVVGFMLKEIPDHPGHGMEAVQDSA